MEDMEITEKKQRDSQLIYGCEVCSIVEVTLIRK